MNYISDDEYSVEADLNDAPEYETYEDPNEQCLPMEELVQNNLSKNVRQLRTFFASNNFVTEKGDHKTNITNISEKKTYYIPPHNIEEFFEAVDVCRKEKRTVCYAERQETDTQTVSGIMLDFDHYQKTRAVQIQDIHFNELVRRITRIIQETVEYTEYIVNFNFIFGVFITRKPEIAACTNKLGETEYKDGFHILIPELQVTKGYKKFLIGEILSRGVLKDVFHDVPSADKMLDVMSSSVPVQFFGNTRCNKPPYVLCWANMVKFYRNIGECERDLIDVKKLAGGEITQGPLSAPITLQINLTYELSLGFYFPTLGDNPTWLKKRHIKYKEELEGKIQTIVEKTAGGVFSDEELRQDEEDISIVGINNAKAKHILELVKLLDASYTGSYEKWFKVLCAIAHTGIGEDFKSVAREFSKRRPQSWNPAEFERVWGEAINGRWGKSPLTLGSINHWAKICAPSAYAKLQHAHYTNILLYSAFENEGRIEQSTVAKLTKIMCGDKFVVDVGVNEKTGRYGYCWFEFVTPGQVMKKGEIFKWRMELEPDNVHLFLGEQMPKIYMQVRDILKARKDNAGNEAEAKYWLSVEKNFRQYQTKLGADGFQNGAVRQSHYTFRQRGFYDELDSYEDVIGVGNGVLKLGVHPQLIRGYHEYKISKYTEVNYVPFNPKAPRTRRLLKAFREIFPEPDVFRFKMMHASTGLDSKESACLLLFEIGGGQNGKTFFEKMVHNTLGDQYCAIGKSTLLTAPMEKGDSANSAQMQQRGKNYFYFDEFGSCEVLNTARLKGMVNPGKQSGRDVYSKQCNFKNTCNPVVLSNFELIVETRDHGTWRRILYYKNKMKFCKNPDPNSPWEKKVDPSLIDDCTNDPLYLEDMMSILVHYNKILCRDYKGDIKNVPCPTIDRETEEYRNRMDSINRFITQMMVKSPSTEHITHQVLASRYIEWYGATVKSEHKFNISSLQSDFENSRLAAGFTMHETGDKVLYGYRIKHATDEYLRDGEESLITKTMSQHVLDPIHELYATNDINDIPNMVAETVPDRETDEFLVDLCNVHERNAPIHLQNRDLAQEDNVVDDDLNDILNDLGL